MGVSGSEVLEGLIETINVALEAGAWPQVVQLTAELYEVAEVLFP